jgi:hypothetical protein
MYDNHLPFLLHNGAFAIPVCRLNSLESILSLLFIHFGAKGDGCGANTCLPEKKI